MIYSNYQIENNALYNTVMEEINALWYEVGQPVEFYSDENRRTTTGNHATPFWNADNIGDWDGREDDAAAYANTALEEVFDALGLMGNGGIVHAYRCDEWARFQEAAQEIIDEFHARGAFEKLCHLDGVV